MCIIVYLHPSKAFKDIHIFFRRWLHVLSDRTENEDTIDWVTMTSLQQAFNLLMAVVFTVSVQNLRNIPRCCRYSYIYIYISFRNPGDWLFHQIRQETRTCLLWLQCPVHSDF